jgi:hypothetical protein
MIMILRFPLFAGCVPESGHFFLAKTGSNPDKKRTFGKILSMYIKQERKIIPAL